MKLLKILLLIYAPILLNSCASILCSNSQTITLKTNEKVKLFIDSIYIEEGTNFNTVINRDLCVKQVKIEKEGYKPSLSIILQNSKSNWVYLNLITVYYTLLFDFAKCTWLYKDNYTLSELRRYNHSDTVQKRLLLTNIGFGVNKNNCSISQYDYDNYLDGKKPSNVKKLDSIGLINTTFSDDLEEVLKKLNYIDTVNTVFIDNVNTLTISAKVLNVNYNEVKRKYDIGATDKNSFFFDTNLSTEWSLQDAYGDTLYTEIIKSISGQYSLDNFKFDKAEKLSMSDALENSMLDFLDSLKKKNYLNLESGRITFRDKVSIRKPTKLPTNIEEAMKATVTVKNKDGHGSGFLISNDGYIITNHHVISKTRDYTVILNDGTEYKAKVIRSNKALDLALIKIDGVFDFAFTIPEKQNYKVGDEILAIGTPKSVQLGQSVSKGIVSGARKNKEMNYLQTDIKINRGNSGGPIVLTNGQLTSVVEFKIIGQGIEGLSFSIPAYDIFPSLYLSY